MAILKKQTFGSISALVALVLAVVGLIIYWINIGTVGYFEDAAVAPAATALILSIVALIAVIVVAQLNLGGMVDKILDIVSGLLRIAAPAGLIAAAMLLIEARANGLAFIYFSNEEVLAEVQTAANLSSATCAIVGIVMLVVATIVAIVSAFFRVKKEA